MTECCVGSGRVVCFLPPRLAALVASVLRSRPAGARGAHQKRPMLDDAGAAEPPAGHHSRVKHENWHIALRSEGSLRISLSSECQRFVSACGERRFGSEYGRERGERCADERAALERAAAAPTLPRPTRLTRAAWAASVARGAGLDRAWPGSLQQRVSLWRA